MTQWEEVLKEVRNYQNETLKDEGVNVWFRGQSCAKWSLESTLHRFIRRAFDEFGLSLDEIKAISILWEQYKTLYIKYKSKAWNLLNQQERSEWGIIFSMRHHGVPTILLDWTESFVFALYFANLNRNPNQDASIFILHPSKLNLKSVQQNHLIFLEEELAEKAVVNISYYHPRYKRQNNKLPPIAVTPVLTNQRMVVQRCNFIICGDGFQPLETEYQDSIKKIILPANTYKESQEFLALNGLTHFSLFPDFYGLKEELIQELEDQILLVKEKMKREKER